MEKDSFILYTEQKEVVDKLTDEQAGKIFKAIYEYVKTDKMPKLDGLLDIVIIPFKQSLDRNMEKWVKTYSDTIATFAQIMAAIDNVRKGDISKLRDFAIEHLQ